MPTAWGTHQLQNTVCGCDEWNVNAYSDSVHVGLARVHVTFNTAFIALQKVACLPSSALGNLEILHTK